MKEETRSLALWVVCLFNMYTVRYFRAIEAGCFRSSDGNNWSFQFLTMRLLLPACALKDAGDIQPGH